MNTGTIPYLAQQAMDRYYQSYKSDTSFFTIDDFKQYILNSIGDYYQSIWQLNYKQLLAEKKDEVVTFDPSVLSTQIITVSDDNKFKSSFKEKLQDNVMSFLSDLNNCGFQFAYYKQTDCDDFDTKAIRTTVLQKNSLKYTPITDRIYVYIDGDCIGIVNKRMMPIKEIKVYYVPSISEDMFVPEAIRQKMVDAAVVSLRGEAKDVVVKREDNNNPNMNLQSEMDLMQLKP